MIDETRNKEKGEQSDRVHGEDLGRLRGLSGSCMSITQYYNIIAKDFDRLTGNCAAVGSAAESTASAAGSAPTPGSVSTPGSAPTPGSVPTSRLVSTPGSFSIILGPDVGGVHRGCTDEAVCVRRVALERDRL